MIEKYCDDGDDNYDDYDYDDYDYDQHWDHKLTEKDFLFFDNV